MNFRLESILSLKKNIEQMKQKELADAFMQKQVLVDKQNSLLLTEQKVNAQVKQNLTGPIDTTIMPAVSNFQNKLKKDKQIMENQVAKASEVVIQKQDNLVEAMKERKILDNLKSMHIEQIKYEMIQSEQKLADEIVGYNYAKKGTR